VQWLREGDRNTAFFDAKLFARKRTNKDDDSLCFDQVEIKGMAHHFYEDLFTSEPGLAMDPVLDAIPSKVDDRMNEDLCKTYSNEEINDAMFQMGPTKAPGPGGFMSMFYQVHWDLIRTRYVMLFEASCVVLRYMMVFVIWSLF
jgi:hypothetical protein